MYRHNGNVRGSQAANTAVMFSVQLPRGRKNGSFMGGGDRLSVTPANNVDKQSGIWSINGMHLVDQDIVTTTYQDNSYWTDPPPYQQFVETGRTAHATGPWYPNCPAAQRPCGPQPWGCGGNLRGTGSPFGLNTWTYIGPGSNGCADPWIYTTWNQQGYYRTVDPPPVYTEQIDEVNTTTTHTVWSFFN